MTKSKMIKWGVLCAAILCAAAVILFRTPGRTYTLTLPEAEKLESILLTQGTDTTAVSDMRALLELLTGTERKTKTESIQDSPVNAENLVQIDFRFKEQGTSTVFVYQKGRAFFIEQPYNGVYRISEEEFREIQEMLL